MTDTAATGRHLETIATATDPSHSPFSWSAAIAGALAAAAVTFVVISLGSGIGLSLSSPYRAGPSATTLTVLGAVWLVFAQALGFATGGYLAARLRRPLSDAYGDETSFRDAAQGMVVWAIGVVAAAILAAWLSMAAVGTAVQAGATLAGGAAAGAGAVAGQNADMLSSSLDSLLRSRPAPAQGDQANNQAGRNDDSLRSEIGRIVANTVAGGQLSQDDRTYLVQVVASRAGISEQDAQKRVDDTINAAREKAKQAADTAAKAGAMTSFWTFMSLIIGAAAAVLGGIVGGELRDHDSRYVRRR